MEDINFETILKLKAIADFEEEELVTVINNVLQEGIKCYEGRNGKCKSLERY